MILSLSSQGEILPRPPSRQGQVQRRQAWGSGSSRTVDWRVHSLRLCRLLWGWTDEARRCRNRGLWIWRPDFGQGLSILTLERSQLELPGRTCWWLRSIAGGWIDEKVSSRTMFSMLRLSLCFLFLYPLMTFYTGFSCIVTEFKQAKLPARAIGVWDAWIKSGICSWIGLWNRNPHDRIHSHLNLSERNVGAEKIDGDFTIARTRTPITIRLIWHPKNVSAWFHSFFPSPRTWAFFIIVITVCFLQNFLPLWFVFLLRLFSTDYLIGYCNFCKRETWMLVWQKGTE